ncbi:MAG: M14 family zinc carboxypeptidase [Bacteroidota bacterium]
MKRLIFLVCLASISFAQEMAYFFPRGTYDSKIPSPKSILGYEIGERFTDYRNLEKYIEKLTASSDRIKRIYYGETNEHRPLQTLIISSPKNLTRLDEIQAANKKLTDPRNFKSRTDAEPIVKSLPVIVYLSYGVHGNEASSPEAAMLTAYQLCAGTDQRTLDILEHAIVIIDPNVNPDGRERYVQWANSTLGTHPNTNPFAIEHSEPWPGGRTNHYYFDLNRDWSWQTQKETRARIQMYREWMPHVHVDYHEMGYASTYFFFPAAAPFHESLPPEVKKWGQIFGRGNAEAFDRLGVAYFVGEQFDMFYPGYGDSWPTFNGAIGMTYEQAGGSRGGIAVRKPDGKILTLRDRARNHFVTSIATLETSVKNRQERLEDFYKFWEGAMTQADRAKGYLILQANDPSRAAQLAATLLRQGIEVFQLQEPIQFQAQRFFSSRVTKETFPKGTYFVSLQQPEGRLIKAILEPTAVAKDTFFYDVSAWSLPVAAGLTAYSTESPMPSNARKVTEPPEVPGTVIGEKAVYAYLIPWERNSAVKLVWQLLEKKYSLSVARRSFQTAGRTFSPGTVVAFAGENRDSLRSDMDRLAAVNGVDVYAVSTGLTEKGVSLGSGHVAPLKKSEIAIVTGSPVSSIDYGELWYLFEQEVQIPFTGIRATELGEIDLSKFDVLIIPDGFNYQSVFDSAKVDKMKRWVQSGGVLIGLEGGAQFLTKSKSGITTAVLRSEKKEDEKTKEEKEQEKAKKEITKRQSFFEKEERDRLERIPGTVFKVLVDTTHPIGYGYPSEIHVFKSDAGPYELAESGHNVARFSKDSVQTSGYASREKAQKVADAAYIADFRIGRGRAVLFSENVTFRRFWTGLQKLLLNSILFLPQPD